MISNRTSCRQLLEDKDIMFAGYKIPHPLQYQLLIKVRAPCMILMNDMLYPLTDGMLGP